MKFCAFNLTPYNAYFIFVNFVNIKQELLHYMRQIFTVSVFYVLQGSGVTLLKYGKIYDVDFVSNFVEKDSEKKLKIGYNLPNL